MSIHYSSDDTVKAITNAIQDTFGRYAHKRKNYGHHFIKKFGVVKVVAGHEDHICLSVNYEII
jgi:hypothetical protein